MENSITCIKREIYSFTSSLKISDWVCPKTYLALFLEEKNEFWDAEVLFFLVFLLVFTSKFFIIFVSMGVNKDWSSFWSI